MLKLIINRATGLATMLAITISAGAAIMVPDEAAADSCWYHNGSLMRLVASGNKRWFYYEQPRQILRRAGVTRGTLLFNGSKRGNRYTGTARRFSKWCGSPLQYGVSGPVSGNQRRVTVSGSRDVFASGCRNTGRVARDRLVFTYSHQC